MLWYGRLTKWRWCTSLIWSKMEQRKIACASKAFFFFLSQCSFRFEAGSQNQNHQPACPCCLVMPMACKLLHGWHSENEIPIVLDVKKYVFKLWDIISLIVMRRISNIRNHVQNLEVIRTLWIHKSCQVLLMH